MPSSISLEEFEKNDLGAQLEQMIKGTAFDKKLDAYLDDMERRGLSEEQILQEMLGGKQNLDDLNAEKGVQVEISPDNLKGSSMQTDLFDAFKQAMEKDIKPEELEKLKVKFEVEMEQAKSDANEGKK